MTLTPVNVWSVTANVLFSNFQSVKQNQLYARNQWFVVELAFSWISYRYRPFVRGRTVRSLWLNEAEVYSFLDHQLACQGTFCVVLQCSDGWCGLCITTF